MSLGNTKKTITDGLVVALDAANLKSFRGEQTSNRYTGDTDSFPKVGNGFGTYNTNQYNNNTYFSIGTVSAVTNNVVTMSAAHPLRTYDVVTPQTTGGGVTAGTNYYVDKKSSTTFTLHQYDSSENGSKGFEVLRPIRNDTRISINSTSFPTMWWGPPHLPNSGLIKTIVPNGFNGHDCMRWNFYRPDGVCDGMAYGVYLTIASSTTYTYSYYARAADSNAVGKTISWSLHWYAVGYGTSLASVVLTKDWQRVTSTVTTPAGSAGSTNCYWFISSGPCTVDVAEIQCESKSYATDFTSTSRGTTVAANGGWRDMTYTGNNGTLNNNPTKGNDFGGSLILNGTNQYVSITPVSNTIRTYDASIVFAVKLPLYSGGQRCILSYRGGSGGALYIGKVYGGIYCYYDQLNNPGYIIGSITDGAPVVVTILLNASGNTISTYINGSLAGSATRTGWVSAYNTVVNLGYDAGGTNEYMTGSFYYYAHYNRVLSDSEIQTTYKVLKDRLKL
jgi:hypothetical protein